MATPPTRGSIRSTGPWPKPARGVAAGFELAEEELIGAADHADGLNDRLADAFTPEVDAGAPRGIFGEADHE